VPNICPLADAAVVGDDPDDETALEDEADDDPPVEDDPDDERLLLHATATSASTQSALNPWNHRRLRPIGSPLCMVLRKPDRSGAVSRLRCNVPDGQTRGC